MQLMHNHKTYTCCMYKLYKKMFGLLSCFIQRDSFCNVTFSLIGNASEHGNKVLPQTYDKWKYSLRNRKWSIFLTCHTSHQAPYKHKNVFSVCDHPMLLLLKFDFIWLFEAYFSVCLFVFTDREWQTQQCGYHGDHTGHIRTHMLYVFCFSLNHHKVV